MKYFEKISYLDCSVETLFNFHLDIKNLKNISPLNVKVELINKDFTPYEGGVLKIRTQKNYLSTIWEVQILKIEEPNLLVDIGLKSPFKYWKHYHIFTKKGNQSQMKDIIEYELPFGKIGNLFDFFVRNELKKMFEFRHEKTKKLLSFNEDHI